MNSIIQPDYAGGDVVNDEPFICVFEKFLSDDEIEHLIQAGSSNLEPAKTIRNDGVIENTGRTGSIGWISQRHDPVITALSERVSRIVGLPSANSEPYQLVQYRTQQYYAPHYDGWDSASEAGKRCMARSGQRLVTCLLYLNDVIGSGGTVFPKLRIGIGARKGRLLVFHNCYNGSARLHPDSVHGGLPVKSGEKWVCNLWFRERGFD